MTPLAYLEAARVPDTLQPQQFGLWTIQRQFFPLDHPERVKLGWPSQTVLRHETMATLHLVSGGEIVMEDSAPELRRHLPIWLEARGTVLMTGLGLGCVVRGLLANPAVTHVDVLELDRDIIRIIGAEFAGNSRVTIEQADALDWHIPHTAHWDYAWHDLWTDGDIHLQQLHMRLFLRFESHVAHRQGAWAFPRQIARIMPWLPLGAPVEPRSPRNRARRAA